jgi:hypothetical protein
MQPSTEKMEATCCISGERFLALLASLRPPIKREEACHLQGDKSGCLLCWGIPPSQKDPKVKVQLSRMKGPSDSYSKH